MRKFLAWLALAGEQSASPNTGAYCSARGRLPLSDLEQLRATILGILQGPGFKQASWCGRSVKVVDGSSISMPDTPANQERYPQPRTQKPGCGFPVMRIVALFSLGTGFLLDLAKGPLSTGERSLFRTLWDQLKQEDVVLADRGFCSYADFYLLQQRGVDCVMRNHPRREAGVRHVNALGNGDRLVEWIKTKIRPQWLTLEAWQAIPPTLLVRQLDLTVDVPGFRSQRITVATTLLDAKRYTKEKIAELYRKRWMAELYLRDIKISLGMDILRCKNPEMVEKELCMHLIAYNLIRALMCNAAHAHGVDPERLSFKGAIATIRQWAPVIASLPSGSNQLEKMLRIMLYYLAHDRVPLRRDRTEPRARKRRPKNYQLLTKPRHQFKEIPHREKYTKP